MFSTKISTKLTSWQPVTLEEFQVWVYYPLAATINQAMFSNIMQSKYNKENLFYRKDQSSKILLKKVSFKKVTCSSKLCLKEAKVGFCRY